MKKKNPRDNIEISELIKDAIFLDINIDREKRYIFYPHILIPRLILGSLVVAGSPTTVNRAAAATAPSWTADSE